MKSYKYIFISMGATAVLLIIALVVAAYSFNPNKYKPDIAKAVRDVTGRDIVFNGDLEMNFFPWLGFSAKDVSLANAEGFEPLDMLSFKEVSVSVKVLPLISRHVEISTVKIDTLAVNYAVDEAGRTNVDDIKYKINQWGKGGQGSQTDGVPKDEAFNRKVEDSDRFDFIQDLNIKKIEILNLVVTYNDARNNKFLKAGPVEVKTGKINLKKPTEIHINGKLSGVKPSFTADIDIFVIIQSIFEGNKLCNLDLNMSSESTADFHDAQLNSVFISALTANFNIKDKLFILDDYFTDITLEGENIKGGKQVITAGIKKGVFDIAGQAVDIPSITLFSEGVETKASLKGTSLFESPVLTAFLDIYEFSPRVASQTYNPELLKRLGADVLNSFSLSLKADYRNKKLNMPIKIHLDATEANILIKGEFNNKAEFYIDTDVTDINIGHYIPVQKSRVEKATVSPEDLGVDISYDKGMETAPDNNIYIPVIDLRSAPEINGQIKISRLGYNGLHLENLYVPISLKNGELTFDSAKFNIYGGTAVFYTKIKAQGTPIAVDFYSNLRMVNLQNLTEALNAKELPVNIPAKLSWNIKASLRDDILKLNSFNVNLDALRINGNAAAMISGVPHVDFKLSTSDIDTSKYLIKKTTPATSQLNAQTSPETISDTTNKSKLNLSVIPVTMSGEVKIQSLKHDKFSAGNLSVDMTLANGVLSLINLTGNVFGGKFSTTVTVTADGEIVKEDIQFELFGAKTERIIDTFTSLKKPFMSGKLSAKFNLYAMGLSKDEILSSMNGACSYQFDSAKINGFGYDPGSFGSESVFFGKGRVTSLGNVKGNAGIKNGYLGLEKTRFSAGNLSGDFEGGFGLLDLGLNFKVNLAAQNITVPLTIKGNINKPLFTIEESAFIKQNLESQRKELENKAAREIEKQKNKLKENFDKEAEKALQNFFR